MPAGDFGRIFANSYRKSFLLCAAHDYSSHVAACRINNLQLELAKIRLSRARQQAVLAMRRSSNAPLRLMPHTFVDRSLSARIVGQPIVAAVGF